MQASGPATEGIKKRESKKGTVVVRLPGRGKTRTRHSPLYRVMHALTAIIGLRTWLSMKHYQYTAIDALWQPPQLPITGFASEVDAINPSGA